MATIKSYTDIPQSKTLSKILPLESADMTYIRSELIPYPYCDSKFKGEDNVYPAWSLAALLDILPDMTCVYKKTYKDGRIKYQGVAGGIKDLILKDNPVDACYEVILKLHKLNLL